MFRSVPLLRSELPAEVKAQLAADWHQVQRFQAEMVVMVANNAPKEERDAFSVRFREAMAVLDARLDDVHRRYPRRDGRRA